MNTVFLDCGGFNGSSVRYFREAHDPDGDIPIHTFEPNKRYWNCYGDFDNHTLHPVAIDYEYGYKKFYLSKHGFGSTLVKTKTTGKLNKRFPIYVHTINFGRWIESYIAPFYDEIIVKMDIEGAEYEVIKHMYLDGSIKLISKLFIEWHWDKIGMLERKHNKIQRLVENIVEPNEWNTIGY